MKCHFMAFACDTSQSRSSVFFERGAFHPLDTALNVVVSLTPVIVLGAPRELIILLGTWVAVHGLYRHCNVQLRLVR